MPRSLLRGLPLKIQRAGADWFTRKTGVVIKRFETDAFFTFHHVNAYEGTNQIVIDLVRYEDAKIIEALKIENDDLRKRIKPCLYRYTLDQSNNTVDYKKISEKVIEMPRINYDRYNMYDYSYVYGTADNQLVKINVKIGEDTCWEEEGCTPGEPVFVEEPGAQREDQGVVLSVVLDSINKNSFALILDGQTFKEIGRATIPHHIPFGLHGNFYQENK